MDFLFLRAVRWRPAGGLYWGRWDWWRKSKKDGMVRSKKKAFRKEVLEVVRVGKS